jgi:enterochelin esterase-like enzyme
MAAPSGRSIRPLPRTQQADPSAFENDLLQETIPFAEKLYRISATPDDRALAGLSMGGQTLQIGLKHLRIPLPGRVQPACGATQRSNIRRACRLRLHHK